jgi:hypothetical protein
MTVIIELGAPSGRPTGQLERCVRAPGEMSGIIKSMEAEEYSPSVARICDHASRDRTAIASGIERARLSLTISGVGGAVVFNAILLS